MMLVERKFFTGTKTGERGVERMPSLPVMFRILKEGCFYLFLEEVLGSGSVLSVLLKVFKSVSELPAQ